MFYDEDIDDLTAMVITKKRISAKARKRAKIAAAAAVVGTAGAAGSVKRNVEIRDGRKTSVVRTRIGNREVGSRSTRVDGDRRRTQIDIGRQGGAGAQMILHRGSRSSELFASVRDAKGRGARGGMRRDPWQRLSGGVSVDVPRDRLAGMIVDRNKPRGKRVTFTSGKRVAPGWGPVPPPPGGVKRPRRQPSN